MLYSLQLTIQTNKVSLIRALRYESWNPTDITILSRLTSSPCWSFTAARCTDPRLPNFILGVIGWYGKDGGKCRPSFICARGRDDWLKASPSQTCRLHINSVVATVQRRICQKLRWDASNFVMSQVWQKLSPQPLTSNLSSPNRWLLFLTEEELKEKRL